MSTLLEQASLVLIPSGYKEDTVYSVIPSNGGGDMSFTRASDGTRINSDGLVEVTPWNIFQYSEDFTNAYWTKTNSTITANATTSPDGNTTADKVIASAIGGDKLISRITTSPIGTTYTSTAYYKASENTLAWMRLGGVTNDPYVIYNLSTQAIVSSSNLVSSSISSMGNGWYKVTATVVSTGVLIAPCLFVLPATGYTLGGDNIPEFTGNGTDGGFIWGAQLNIGSTAKPYFPTTDRLNVPRLTYQNGGGGCPSLLLEPQRTNVLTYSQDLSNVLWGKNGVTVSLSSTDFLTLEKSYLLAETTASSTHLLAKTTVVTIGVINTYSIYFKKGTGSSAPDIIRLRSLWSDAYVNFNIVTGTKLYQSGPVISAKITAEINGWFRCTMTYQGSTSNNNEFMIQFVNNTNTSVANLSYVGNVNADVFVAGGQNEVGSYPTSYIPTTSASATRVADACSKTGISSLIGQTEGVLFTDFVCNGFKDWGTPLSVNNGTTGQEIWITTFTNGNIRAELYNGAVQASITYTGGVVGQRYKLAFAYKTNDFAMYVNGSLVGTDVSGTTFSGTTLSRLDFDNTSAASYGLSLIQINQAILFKTRLTNSELATLTTI
jgi:hypothetical protein